MKEFYKELIRRQRFMVFQLISIIGSITSILIGAIYYWLSPASASIWIAQIILSIVLTANIILVRYHQKYRLAYTIALVSGFFSVLMISWHTGGYSSPALFYLIIVVFATYILFNRRTGRISVTASLAVVLLLVVVKDYTPTSILPESAMEYNTSITLILTLLLVSFFAYAVDKSKDMALREFRIVNEELKTASKELERLNLAVSNTDNAIMITDKDGQITWVNKGFVKISGYSLEEVIGTHGEMLRNEKKTGLSDPNIYQKCIDERRSVRYIEKNISKSGREYWMATTLTPIFDDNGDLTNLIVIDTDITDRKNMEQELIEAIDTAEESVHTQREFINNVSKEIQSPLYGIISMANDLSETELTDEQRTLVETVRMSARTLNLTLNDILDLTKIKARR